jgi:hypothetical protein
MLPTKKKNVPYYKTDTSSRQGRRPMKNRTITVLTTAKTWPWAPEGLNAKTDWLTDRQSQSNSDSDPDISI